MNHRFQCRCGAVRGEIAHTGQAVRAVCYCTDCQAYARLLGQAPAVLDAHGGTEIVATRSGNVRFTSGTADLACLSLSPRGLLRWYASCCDTPIANTPRNWKMPYAGMVHSCLRHPDPLERAFPDVQLAANTKSAIGKPTGATSMAGVARFARTMLRLGGDRLTGRYRVTPFFDAHGAPVAAVVVADKARVEAARRERDAA